MVVANMGDAVLVGASRPRGVGAALAVVVLSTFPVAGAGAAEEPPTIKVPVRELCQLQLKDDRLMFFTAMPLTGVAPRPVEVEGLPGETRASHRPYRFTLENEHDTPGGLHVTLSVERRRMYFRLQRSVSPANGTGDQSSIDLMQSYADDATTRVKPGQVHLTVRADGEQVAGIDAEDFSALRRQDPKVFYRYVMPALRDLKAEGLVAVEPWVARQVLADRVAPRRCRGWWPAW